MARGEGAFFVKTAPSPLVLSPSPKKLSSGRAAGPRRWLAAGRKGHVWSWGREKEGGEKLGREDAGVFSRSRLLPGRWNTSGSMGRGLPAMKRRIRRGSSLIMAAGTPQGGTLFVQRAVFRGYRAAMPEGLVGLPDACCLVVGPERRGEAGRSETRAGILRLGAALAGKADAVLKSWQALLRCSIRKGQCREPYVSSPRGELPRMPGGLRSQKSPPCGGLCHSRWADRLPGLSSGGRPVMSGLGRACRTV